MARPKTYIAFVIDKSGSMAGTEAQVVSDFNEQIQQAKENSKDQDISVSLVTFNGAVYEHIWLEDVANVEEITRESYRADGGTAMRDAIGYTIKKLNDTVEDKDDENVAFLINVISDGAENSSRHYDVSTLRNMVSACQETKRWTFAYMGCSESYLKQVAAETAIPIDNMAVWSNATSTLTSNAFKGKNTRSESYLCKRSLGEHASDSYYSDVKGMCADYTSDDMVLPQAPVNLTPQAVWVAPQATMTGTSLPSGSINVNVTNGVNSSCHLNDPLPAKDLGSWSLNKTNSPKFDFGSIQNLVASKPEDYTATKAKAAEALKSISGMRRNMLAGGSEVAWKK